MVGEVAIQVSHGVEGHDCLQGRRLSSSYKILDQAKIGLANHGYFAIAPGLMRFPFHQLVAILLLLLIKEVPLAFRGSRAPGIGDDIGVSPGNEVFDVSRLYESKDAAGKTVLLLPIGGDREEGQALCR